jgi:hypothetical protein
MSKAGFSSESDKLSDSCPFPMVQNGHGRGEACVKFRVHKNTDTAQQYNPPFGTIWLLDFRKKKEQRAVSVNPKGKKRSSGLVRGPSNPIFCKIREIKKPIARNGGKSALNHGETYHFCIFNVAPLRGPPSSERPLAQHCIASVRSDASGPRPAACLSRGRSACKTKAVDKFLV